MPKRLDINERPIRNAHAKLIIPGILLKNKMPKSKMAVRYIKSEVFLFKPLI